MIAQTKSAVKSLLNRWPQRINRREFESQVFVRHNERPVEFAFVFRQMAQLAPLKILDVGTGTTALPHMMRNCGALVTAVDNMTDYWTTETLNRHFHVLDDDITATKLTEQFDMVTCISVLEHIHKFDDAVGNMLSLLKPGGHLVLTCPYTENGYVRNVYELPGSSYGQKAAYITQSYSRSELDRWLQTNDAEIVEQEFWQYWTGDHWTVDEQIIPPVKASADTKHQLTCLLIRKN